MVVKKTKPINQKKQQALKSEPNILSPSSYKQALFLNSQEDIIIYGGAAYGGKTHVGLLRFLRYVDDPEFVGYVFRKNGSDLKKKGGAFPLALKLYKLFDPNLTYTQQPMCITFSNGATISFTGIDGADGMQAIQGIEIHAAMVDEATHITEEAFWWIYSRLRSSKTMSPHIFLTCNPEPDCFFLNWIEPYIHPLHTYLNDELVEGRVNQEVNGKVRYFIKSGDNLIWADSVEQLKEENPLFFYDGSPFIPQTFRFIGANCQDNPIALQNDPAYVPKLLTGSRVKVERLYHGNWYCREEGSSLVQRSWFEVIPKIDKKVKYRIRAWDIAATLKSEKNPDPDYTASVLIARTEDGDYIIEDVFQERISIMKVLDKIAEVAKQDQEYCDTLVKTFIPQDPNAQAEYTARTWVRELATKGVGVQLIKTSGAKSKAQRFLPFAAVAEVGLVKVLKADWNDKYFSELERFDGTRKCGHDDKHTCRL